MIDLEKLPDATLVIHDETVVVPCFRFDLALKQPCKEGLVDFYRRARAALGSCLTHFRGGSMETRRKVTERTETMLPIWLKGAEQGDSFEVELHGSKDDASPASLSVFVRWYAPEEEDAESERMRLKEQYQTYGTGGSNGIVECRVTFPLDHDFAKRPDAFLSWVRSLRCIERGQFLSAGAGYGLSYYPFRYPTDVDIRLAALCTRHIGLSWGGHDFINLVRWDPERDNLVWLFLRAEWLTLLGPLVVRCLGGKPSLRERLEAVPGVRLYDVGDGLIVQAGDAPQVGDVTRGDLLPIQREVAKILRPARALEMVGTGGVEEEWVDDWLDAFDKDWEVS
jgi:hypothetical protein